MDQPVPHPRTGFLPLNLPISANTIDERTFEAHETREGHSRRDGEARCVSDRWTQPCEDSPHLLFASAPAYPAAARKQFGTWNYLHLQARQVR